jgi:hypothetical protein
LASEGSGSPAKTRMVASLDLFALEAEDKRE